MWTRGDARTQWEGEAGAQGAGALLLTLHPFVVGPVLATLELQVHSSGAHLLSANGVPVTVLGTGGSADRNLCPRGADVQINKSIGKRVRQSYSH